MENMRLQAGRWQGGTLLNPRKGWLLDCEMWLDKGDLKVRASFGFLQRTQLWQRADAATLKTAGV